MRAPPSSSFEPNKARTIIIIIHVFICISFVAKQEASHDVKMSENGEGHKAPHEGIKS